MTSLSTFTLPDHTQLPDSDGTFVFAKRAGGKNWQEHPQCWISPKPLIRRSNATSLRLLIRRSNATSLRLFYQISM